MSFFDRMNRSQKRKFNKLKKEEQLEIFTHELNEKVKVERNKAVAVGFADGFLFASNMMYEKFFEKWHNATPSDREEIAREFMEYLQKGHDKYVERHVKKENKQEESENQ